MRRRFGKFPYYEPEPEIAEEWAPDPFSEEPRTRIHLKRFKNEKNEKENPKKPE